MKKFLVWCLCCIFGLWVYVAYATSTPALPDNFQVEVNPSSFKVNQAVDLTITAIKNGEVMKNYEWYFDIVVLDENNNILQSHEVTVPDGWWWSIRLQDQGTRPYTQWLILSKAGTFTVSVTEFTKDSVEGKATITVTNDEVIDVWTIDIYSPDQNVTEESSAIPIFANAPDYANSRIQIFLNDLLVKEWQTDANWMLNETIQVTKEWTNTLELKAVNLQGATVAQSQVVTFNYSPVPTDFAPEVIMSPNRDLKIWDLVKFEVWTDEHVSSVSLSISGVQDYPMDKEWDWYFTKQVQLLATWDQVVNVQVTAATEPKLYTWLYYFTVEDNIKIVNLKIYADKTTNWLIHLEWETVWWVSDDYVVTYWAKWAKEEDAWTDFAKWPNHDVHVGPWQTYMFRVYATTPEHIAEWVPSEISEYEYLGLGSSEGPTTAPITQNPRPDDPTTGEVQEHPAQTWEVIVERPWIVEDIEEEHYVPDAPTCIITSIQFDTEKIGNKNYLVWSPIKNVEKYLIYKSDFADWSNKKYVGETELPRFEYPFDAKAKEEIYAYYSIEAVCSDGRKMMVSEANKVQVWPFEDMMLILVATVLLYLMYRIYTYRV